MKVTLLGVLVVLAGVALLVYVGYELQRRNKRQQPGIRIDPAPPLNP